MLLYFIIYFLSCFCYSVLYCIRFHFIIVILLPDFISYYIISMLFYVVLFHFIWFHFVLYFCVNRLYNMHIYILHAITQPTGYDYSIYHSFHQISPVSLAEPDRFPRSLDILVPPLRQGRKKETCTGMHPTALEYGGGWSGIRAQTLNQKSHTSSFFLVHKCFEKDVKPPFWLRKTVFVKA